MQPRWKTAWKWKHYFQKISGSLCSLQDWCHFKKWIPVAGCLQTCATTLNLPWVSRLPANPANSGLARLYSCVNQFLKINLSLSLSLSLSLCPPLSPPLVKRKRDTPTPTHVDFVSLENPNTNVWHKTRMTGARYWKLSEKMSPMPSYPHGLG